METLPSAPDVELGKNRGDKVVLTYKIREERKQQESHKIMHSCAALKSSSEKLCKGFIDSQFVPIRLSCLFPSCRFDKT
jgi:hypothetical protein